MNSTTRGRLISFEGIDGAGKSSHVQFMSDLLSSRGISHVVTREPGGTALGEKIRAICLHESMHLETEALLIFAARREHIDKLIEPALARGDYVITDRFTDSSFAFQGGGRGVGIDKLNLLEQWVHDGLQPDITFLFDLPTNIAKGRMSSGRVLDRFELEPEDFHQNVRSEYLRRARQFSKRFRVIDSTQSIIEIQNSLCILMDKFFDDPASSLDATVPRSPKP